MSDPVHGQPVLVTVPVILQLEATAADGQRVRRVGSPQLPFTDYSSDSYLSGRLWEGSVWLSLSRCLNPHGSPPQPAPEARDNKTNANPRAETASSVRNVMSSWVTYMLRYVTGRSHPQHRPTPVIAKTSAVQFGVYCRW